MCKKFICKVSQVRWEAVRMEGLPEDTASIFDIVSIECEANAYKSLEVKVEV